MWRAPYAGYPEAYANRGEESIMWPFVRHGDEGETASDGRRIMNAARRTITGIATVGIPVTDQDRALGFYTEALGMAVSVLKQNVVVSI
jgi:hypothetical protein